MTQQYRPDIDGLRAIAVLLVVVYHAFPVALPGGFLGVDIFFVISGYLITRDIIARQAADSFSLTDFYGRRARRILPALAVVLLATLSFGAVVLYSDEFDQLLQHVLASALFSQNFRLMSEAGYFDTASNAKPLLHLWSLAVEEQFYLLWPVALMMLKTRRAALVAALLTVALSAAAMHALSDEPSLAYYLPFTRFWQIMAGATLALLALPRLGVRAQHWLGAIGLGLCLAAPAVHTLGGGMLIDAAVPTLGAALCIAGGPSSIAARVLGRPLLVWLGLISYPLYLWHWPLLAYLNIMAPAHSAVVAAAAVLCAVALAEATRRWIETPLRRPWVTPKISGAVASLASSTAVAAVAGLLLMVPMRQPLAGEAGLADLSAPRKERFVACEAEMPRGLMTCLQSRHGKTSAVIFGDSHADHLFDGIAEQDAGRNWAVLAQASCPPLSGVTVKVQRDGCGNTPDLVLDRLANDPAVQEVVLSFYGSYAAVTNFAAGHTDRGPAQFTLTSLRAPGASKAEVMALGLDATVDRLVKAGKRVAIVLDVPEIPFQPRDCVARPLMQAAVADCSVSRSVIVGRQSAQRAAAAAVARRFPGVRVFDSLDVLCDGDRCAIDGEGGLLFKDSHHLSRRGSRLVGGAFLAWLNG